MSRKINPAYKPLIILVSVGVIGIGLLLYFKRGTLGETWDALLNARLEYVLLLPVLQAINYIFIGNYYRSMFANFKAHVSLARSWGIVAAMNFVNQILPSGGVSGITYIAYGFRKKIDSGKSTLVQLGRYIFAFSGYALLLPIAIVILILEDNFTKTTHLIEDAGTNPAGLVTAGIFVLFVLVLFLFILHEARSHNFFQVGANLINQVTKPFRRGKPALIPPKSVKKLVNDFHVGVDFVKRNKNRMVQPIGSMLISVVLEIAIVYTALLAVNVHVSLGAVFISYVAANIVGVVSVIPGDVGVHEATVILVLAAFGVPEPAAISATLLYRVFNKIIFLPIGFYFYTIFLKPAEVKEG